MSNFTHAAVSTGHGMLARFANLFRRHEPLDERCEPQLQIDSPTLPAGTRNHEPVARHDSHGRSDASARLRPVPSVADLEGIDPAAAADRRLAILPVEQHARGFLAWLQQDFPAGATLDAAQIMTRYGEWTLDAQVATRSWPAVARKFRPLCGGKKTYRSEGRNRIRVYKIPPRAGRGADRLRAAA